MKVSRKRATSIVVFLCLPLRYRFVLFQATVSIIDNYTYRSWNGLSQQQNGTGIEETS